MMLSLLIFVSVMILTLLWGGFAFGFGYHGQFQIIRNESVIQRTMGISLLFCIISWTVFLGFVVDHLIQSFGSVVDTLYTFI